MSHPPEPLPAAPPPPGRVYVLRIWHEPGDPPTAPVWRASLKEGTLGDRRYFASIDACIDHLYGELIRQ